MVLFSELLNNLSIAWDLRKDGAVKDLVKSRGIVADLCDDLMSLAFPSLKRGKFASSSCDDMYRLVIDHKVNASRFATAGTYLSHYLTPEGAELISEYYGVKSDYLHSISAEGYVDFLFEREGGLPTNEYYIPSGGMSTFVDILFKLLDNKGGVVHRKNKVSSIDQKGDNFTLRTTDFLVSASKVVIAIPPVSLIKIQGDVTKNITQHPIFKSIVSVPAFTGAAVYEEAWWNDTLQSKQLFTSYSDCLGITMPYK